MFLKILWKCILYCFYCVTCYSSYGLLFIQFLPCFTDRFFVFVFVFFCDFFACLFVFLYQQRAATLALHFIPCCHCPSFSFCMLNVSHVNKRAKYFASLFNKFLEFFLLLDWTWPENWKLSVFWTTSCKLTM